MSHLEEISSILYRIKPNDILLKLITIKRKSLLFVYYCASCMNSSKLTLYFSACYLKEPDVHMQQKQSMPGVKCSEWPEKGTRGTDGQLLGVAQF